MSIYIITQQIEGLPQAWMTSVTNLLNNNYQIGASQTDCWNTATIRTKLDNKKELSLQIQYNKAENTNIFVAIMMKYLPNDNYMNLGQDFHSCVKIDMSKTSPEQFANYVIKLHKYNTKLMERHLNGIID